MMRRLRCLFQGHKWQIEENYLTQGTEQECLRCGTHRSTYPGDPKLKPTIRPGDGSVGSVGGSTAEGSGPGG